MILDSQFLLILAFFFLLSQVDDVRLRQVYVALVESVKAKNGTVYIFSTLHPSGEQLKGLTGVAAVLRFPMDLSHIDQALDDDDSSSHSSSGGSLSSSTVSSEDEEEVELFNVLKRSTSGANDNNA